MGFLYAFACSLYTLWQAAGISLDWSVAFQLAQLILGPLWILYVILGL